MNIAYVYTDRKKYKYNLFNIVDKKRLNNDYIFKITNTKQKTEFKINKQFKKLGLINIVCSKDIKSDFLDTYYKITGKNLMNYMLYDILKYIFNIQNKKMELSDIYLLIKNDKEKYIENIKLLSYNFKSLNIITDNINKFQKIADILTNKNNCLIYVANNKSKSLLRAKYIINFDLNSDEIEEYNINRNAIIINIEDHIKIKNNSFDGIIINSIEINLSDEIREYFGKILDNFNPSQLYESLINQKQELECIRNRIKKDGIDISYLTGNNGKICEEELIKNLDK